MRPMISITCLNIFMAIKIKIQMVLIMFFTFLLISSNDFGKTFDAIIVNCVL